MQKAHFAALAVFVSIAGISIASYAQTPTAAGGNYAPPLLRIPDGARPTRYQLTLTVVPGEARASGEMYDRGGIWTDRIRFCG